MVFARDEEAIIAQCTPSGSGAIALLRLSGNNALAVAQKMSKLPQSAVLVDQKSHTIHYGWVVDATGAHVDQVLFLLMRAPRTFTGQDTVEITCHNNRFLIEKIIECALQNGARTAQAGEFSRRAYLNGKIDLTQAEAIDDLLQGQTEFALKRSLAQLEGSFSHWIGDIDRQLVKALAWCEASFEFLDDEGDFVVEIRQQLADIRQKIVDAQAVFDQRVQLKQGVRIALVGSVNAGKSSLFNTLLQHNRAIVSPQAGTTRDVIEASVYRQGTSWTLIDTAGIRQTDQVIEQEGIVRSLAEAQKADCVLLVIDGSRRMTSEEIVCYDQLLDLYGDKIIVVMNKSDLPVLCTYPRLAERTFLHFSVGSKDHLSDTARRMLEQALQEKVSRLIQDNNVPFLVNQRQHRVLTRLEQAIKEILALCSSSVQYELVSYHLRDALEQVSELTGKSVSEAALDAVFKEFCVGK